MRLPVSTSLAPATVARLVVVDEIGSTNDALVASAADEPHLSVLVTGSQTAGRGRLRRTWVAPPSESLAISVLVRPDLPADRLGWLGLAAGLAMTRAVATLVPEVALKWPNDVQVRGLKVCGVLAEVVPGGVVVGAGVNLAIPADRLPTDSSTSLGLEGARLEGDALADAVLSAYLTEYAALVAAYAAAGGDADACGLRAAARGACSTLGRRVRILLPGDRELVGVAEDIAATGALVVRGDDGAVTSVSVGDVEHVRPV
jgi:BirA family transcriptional regulator, biotin operon repressor / biotin---[acetyl-CoA-carboxylase] ligase